MVSEDLKGIEPRYKLYNYTYTAHAYVLIEHYITMA